MRWIIPRVLGVMSAVTYTAGEHPGQEPQGRDTVTHTIVTKYATVFCLLEQWTICRSRSFFVIVIKVTN
jgi:hypothetical protein